MMFVLQGCRMHLRGNDPGSGGIPGHEGHSGSAGEDIPGKCLLLSPFCFSLCAVPRVLAEEKLSMNTKIWHDRCTYIHIQTLGGHAYYIS